MRTNIWLTLLFVCTICSNAVAGTIYDIDKLIEKVKMHDIVNTGNADSEQTKSTYEKACELQKNGAYAKAIDLFIETAKAGHIKSYCNLGKIALLEGHPVQAFCLFEFAAERNDPEAQYELGLLYDMVNDKKAFELMKKSSEGGCLKGRYSLAMYYIKGIGTARDLDLGLSIMLKLASEYIGAYNQVNYWDTKVEAPEIAYHIGDLYFNGERVDKDYDLAEHWFKKATREGNKEAQAKLDMISNLKKQK